MFKFSCQCYRAAAAAAHYTRSKSCQSSQKGVKIINLHFRDASAASDNEAGAAGGAGA